MAKELPKPIVCARVRELCACGHQNHGFDPDNPKATACIEDSCDCKEFQKPAIEIALDEFEASLNDAGETA